MSISMGLQLMKERLSNARVNVFTVPCLQDNYAWILQDKATGHLAVVDTPSGKPILEELVRLGVPSNSHVTILNTHHHKDHTGGNLFLKEHLPVHIFGPAKEKIAGIDTPVFEGDVIKIGETSCRVIDIPGHTCGHVGYVFEDPQMVFVGDTMFGHGCGALFEGSFAQMWKSLMKIASLPEESLVFCAHEYTQNNVRFALSIFKQDKELMDVLERVSALRAAGEQTVPSLLSQELRTNPFLRCRLKEYQERFDMKSAVDTFEFMRTSKNVW